MGSYTGRVEQGDGRGGGIRADRYIVECLGLLSRSQLKNRMTELLVNGRKQKPSCRLHGGEDLTVSWEDPEPCRAVPQRIPLRILYENGGCTVINKAQGMVVHPSAGHPDGTVVNAFLGLLEERGEAWPDNPGEELRPGVVHRLDKDTSGVLVLAKNGEYLDYLSSQFRRREVKKRYLALVKGHPPRLQGTIEDRLIRDPHHRKRFVSSAWDGNRESGRGKYALTRYRVRKLWEDWALLEVWIETGRTHQIRVHLKSLGGPVAGDPLYSRPHGRFPGITLMLHAREVILSPAPGEPPQSFKAPVPPRFQRMIRSLSSPG